MIIRRNAERTTLMNLNISEKTTYEDTYDIALQHEDMIDLMVCAEGELQTRMVIVKR